MTAFITGQGSKRVFPIYSVKKRIGNVQIVPSFDTQWNVMPEMGAPYLETQSIQVKEQILAPTVSTDSTGAYISYTYEIERKYSVFLLRSIPPQVSSNASNSGESISYIGIWTSVDKGNLKMSALDLQLVNLSKYVYSIMSEYTQYSEGFTDTYLLNNTNLTTHLQEMHHLWTHAMRRSRVQPNKLFC